MVQPSPAWRAQVVTDETARPVGQGPGSRAVLAALVALVALSLFTTGCTRTESPPAAPPEPGPQAGTVVVETQPHGVEVMADGLVRCRAPCTFRIDPGIHRLSIRKSGFMPWHEDVKVPPGAEVRVAVALVASH
jgi:hypothetical protein